MAALRLFLVLVLLGVTYGETELTVTKVNQAEIILTCVPADAGHDSVVWTFKSIKEDAKLDSICTGPIASEGTCTNSTKHSLEESPADQKFTNLKIKKIEDTDAGTYVCTTTKTVGGKAAGDKIEFELAVAPNVTCSPNKATVGEEAKIVCEFNVNGKKDVFESTLHTEVTYETQTCSEAKNAEADKNHQANTICVKVEELKVTSTATFVDPDVKRNPDTLNFDYSGKLAIESGAPAVPVSWLLLVVCALLVTKF